MVDPPAVMVVLESDGKGRVRVVVGSWIMIPDGAREMVVGPRVRGGAPGVGRRVVGGRVMGLLGEGGFWGLGGGLFGSFGLVGGSWGLLGLLGGS